MPPPTPQAAAAVDEGATRGWPIRRAGIAEQAPQGGREATIRRARQRRQALWAVIAPYWRSRGRVPMQVVIDWQGSVLPFRVLAAHAEYQALDAWARRERIDLARPPVSERVVLSDAQLGRFCELRELDPERVSFTADGEVEVWGDDPWVPLATYSGREVVRELGLRTAPATRCTLRRRPGRAWREVARERVRIARAPYEVAALRVADRRPERRSRRKAARCAGPARRSARSGSRDDGGGSEPGDEPPAPPRGAVGGRERSLRVERRRGELLPAHELVVAFLARLAGAVTR
jgi:hypothetical protein